MRQVIRCVALLLVLGALETTFAVGQQAPKGNPGVGGVAVQPLAGDVTGKVATAGGSSKVLTVAVEHLAYEPNPQAQKGNNNNRNLQNLYRLQAEIQRDQAEIARSRSPQERLRRMQELQRDMARLQMEMAKAQAGGNPQQQPFKVVTKRQDYEFTTDDSTKIRFLNLPTAFDDKGNPKKYSAEEMKELKGPDPRMPGYKGDFDQLRPGHVVKVTIAKKGGAAKTGKDLDKAPLDDDRPHAAIIVVTGEDTPPAQPKKKK